jgi:hypothetical protein
VRAWLNERLAEVWQARGPHPGLGAALSAFGIPEGVLVAHAAQGRLADSEDPWPLVDQWLRAPSSESEAKDRVGATISKTWSAIPDARRDLLRLLSRFDLTIDQATRMYQETERTKAGVTLSDADILANPYVIYEADRFSVEPVVVSTVDRGVFPADQVRAVHPLPPPSRVEEAVDPRRVRALVVDVLEQAAVEGDSLRGQGRVIQDIRDCPLDPDCPLGLDVMTVCATTLPPEIAMVSMANGEPAFQLARLHEARRVIARQVERRRNGQLLHVDADWRAVIDLQFGRPPTDDDGDEELARREKAAALESSPNHASRCS